MAAWFFNGLIGQGARPKTNMAPDDPMRPRRLTRTGILGFGPRTALAVALVIACVPMLIGVQRLGSTMARKRSVLETKRLPPVLDRAGAPGPGRPVIYLVGDSQVAHWPLSLWHDCQIFRSGFAGEATPNIAATVLPLLPVVKPDVVVVISGGNDVGAMALMLPAERRLEIGRSMAAFDRLRDAGRAIGAKVVLVSLASTHRRSALARLAAWVGPYDEIRDTLNEHLASICDDACRIMDLRAVLNIETNGDWDDYFYDGVHLNANAYRKLTDNILEDTRRRSIR